jgi:DNA-binding winged helix-turn-helix (wHTH) protein/TolB-like protein
MTEPIARAYEFSGFRVDPGRRLLVGLDDKPVFLKPKAFDTLLYLVEHAGEVCEKRALMQAIWPGLVVEENNLNQNVSTLRRVLGERRGEHRFIVTEAGRGYRFVAPVTTLTGASAATASEPPAAESLEVAARSTPRARKRLVPVVAASALVVALALATSLWQWWGGDVPLPNSVAVLPFENLSPNPDDAYVAAALHGEILNQLAKIAALNVINQGSMLRYAESRQSLRDIARELNVLTVLTTSVAYSNENVQINSQLTDAASGRLLWADQRGGRIDEIFEIEAQIATNVAGALRAEFSVAEREAVDTPATRNALAYDRYLRAQDPNISLEQALRYLDEATRNDDTFALAYARKAQLYAGQFISSAGREAADPDRWTELETLARAAADKALELDEDTWLAHVALGQLEEAHWRWTDAAREYDLAAKTIPRNVWHPHFAPWLHELDFESAIRDQREVVALNPRSGEEHWILGLYYAYSGDATRALPEFREAQELQPGYVPVRAWVAHAEGILGKTQVALEQLRELETLDFAYESSVSIANFAYAYARNGSTADATRLVEILEDKAPDREHQAGNRALAYLAVRDRDAALRALDTVIDKIENETPEPGIIALNMIQTNVYSDPMLDEPEFVARRKRLRGH